MYFSNFALRAYETYLNDGGKHEYDVVDPRFFKHIKFSGDEMVDGGDYGSETTVTLEFPDEFTPETLSATYQKLVNLEHLSAVGIEPGEIDDAESYVEFDASDLSVYTNERLSKYFNIYVNY